CSTTVYGKFPSFDFGSVTVVDRVTALPPSSKDLDDEYYESVEKQKMSQNFAHYENIIDDPTRCTSWTNILGTNTTAAGSGRISTDNKAVPERSP
ncbi:hypothetical protein ANCDUO_17675, partial [Ancylostoma duodenale]